MSLKLLVSTVSLGLFLPVACSQYMWAQSDGLQPSKTNAKSLNQEELNKLFQERMGGTRLTGKFTILGQDRAPAEETYEIVTVEKMEQKDMWKITARIKYGDHDLTVPMPIAVKWAGKTPVLTVDRLTVPGLGTFDARVLLRKNKYAGTWSHDDVGGHLFGTYEKMAETEKGSGKDDGLPSSR